MKEMLQSKVIIAFIFVMLGIVFLSIPSTKLDNEEVSNQQEIVYANVK